MLYARREITDTDLRVLMRLDQALGFENVTAGPDRVDETRAPGGAEARIDCRRFLALALEALTAREMGLLIRLFTGHSLGSSEYLWGLPRGGARSMLHAALYKLRRVPLVLARAGKAGDALAW